MCRMHIYSVMLCTCAVFLDMFGICDKGICSIFPCLTVSVPGDGGRGEKVRLRLMGEEVCKQVEGRNNESERERGKEEKEKEGLERSIAREGEAEECVKRPRQTCQGTN